jgi:LuxR family maltose regulon positive regulatory protein
MEHLSVGTRCCIPLLNDHIVQRPRLVRLLSDGERRPVTLLSASPGAGKTTLLATWLKQAGGRPAAWLTVHRHDDEQRRLPDLVVEALTRSGIVAATPSSTLSGDDLLDSAFDDIMERRAAGVLVLEDVQELRSPAALATLAQLVDHAPAGLDLVLSTRADPPIGWERAILAGRVGQIRDADLAFDQAEAAALVAAHHVDLNEDDVTTLWSRTEGWAAGLRLAVGALQAEPDPHQFVVDAAATETAVSDYLLDQVVTRQDQTVRDFLLRTCVADRLTPDLVVDLTGDNGAGEVLVEIARRGLFVVELDHQHAYRYHALFQALLQAHLRQHDPDLAADLHRRAGAWHLARGMTDEAELHARAAGDWATVGRLVLDRWLEATAHEGEPPDQDLLADVPAESILQTPDLALIAAVAACRCARREEADLYRKVLDELAPPTVGRQADGDGTTTHETALLVFEMIRGWTFGADDRSRTAVAALRELDAVEVSTPRLRQLAVLATAEQDIAAGELELAKRGLTALAGQRGQTRHDLLASATVAVIDAAAGAVPVAGARLASSNGELYERPERPLAHLTHLAAVLCAAQQRGPSGAAAALDQASGPPEWSSCSARYLDRAVRAAVSGHEPFFVSLDRETAEHPLAARALVALGVLEIVDTDGRLITVGGAGEHLALQVRRQLANGVTGQAVADLESWLDQATTRHPRTAVEGSALAAVTAHRRGDRATACRRLNDAVDLATATTITAPLLTHRDDLRPILEANVGALPSHSAAASDLLDRLHHPSSQLLVEHLTERELQVLQHLPTLMSNTEIARTVHLSVNTVKTHLKAVYRKLGVDGRRAAVLRGRELELL